MYVPHNRGRGEGGRHKIGIITSSHNASTQSTLGKVALPQQKLERFLLTKKGRIKIRIMSRM